MKIVKDTSILVRIPEEDKEKIRFFAMSHGMTISQFVRLACETYMKGETGENGGDI